MTRNYMHFRLPAVRRTLIAAAILTAIGFAPAANAATIRYQFDNVTGTGPWAFYGFPLTIYFYQLGNVGSPIMDLNTTTNIATFGGGFLISPYTNNTNYSGSSTGTAVYDPTTFTLSYAAAYVMQFVTFSSDLDTPGPATVIGMAQHDYYILRPATAVTGGLSVLSVTDTPEPASLALLAVGLAGLTASRRRRRA